MIVCLSGSTKHKDKFFKIAKEETLKGNVVLMPCIFSKTDNVILSKDDIKTLKKVHNERIKMCDLMIVVNGDYGNDTKEEIEYAHKLGKKIVFYCKD